MTPKPNKKSVKKVVMTFQVEVPYDIMIDDESLAHDFGGSITKVARFLYKEEGMWWDGPMKLTSAEVIPKPSNR